MDPMLLCSNVGTASHDDDDLAAAQLRRLGDLAARYGIRIAYEALAWGKFVNDFEHATAHRRTGCPSEHRHLPGQLPYPLPRLGPGRDREDPGRRRSSSSNWPTLPS